jgi:putative nucleotidyltransferase with HDIG domain
MKRILFVDDEPCVLDGLRRMLRAWRQEWETAFARSAAEALDMLRKDRFDVIVSDMRMPGIDGAQLLDEVMRLYPSMVRIILSGQAERESLLRCIGPTHQYLSKPCDAAQLRETIHRALALRQWMAEPSVQHVIAQVTCLPSVPALYAELVEELQSSECSVQRVGEIVSRDVAMTAKIMQLVNSSYFGLRQRIGTPQQATAVLGTEVLRALVLSVHVFSHHEQVQMPRFHLDRLFEHSLAVATLAKAVGRLAGGAQDVVNDTFVAGLLHDVGKLVLAKNLAQKYGQALELAHGACLPISVAETEVFGCSHAEVGAYLLGLWGLPDALVEAVAFHHDPRRCGGQTFGPAAAVHVANGWDHERQPRDDEAFSPIDEAYLETIGCAGKLPAWRESLSIPRQMQPQ